MAWARCIAVAIKILPAAFAEDAGRLRRLEQEAQAAGSLNHPNIVAVYEPGRHDGAPYVVIELPETVKTAFCRATQMPGGV